LTITSLLLDELDTEVDPLLLEDLFFFYFNLFLTFLAVRMASRLTEGSGSNPVPPKNSAIFFLASLRSPKKSELNREKG